MTACTGVTEVSTTQLATTTTEVVTAPARGPSEISADAQESDGSSIVVASVTLPSQGFIAVHADMDGHPGPVIGHSDLLPAGTSTNVTVTLDEPLTASATLWPMVHIDMNSDGVYDFDPPVLVEDSPGLFADNNIAVISVEITVP